MQQHAQGYYVINITKSLYDVIHTYLDFERVIGEDETHEDECWSRDYWLHNIWIVGVLDSYIRHTIDTYH